MTRSPEQPPVTVPQQQLADAALKIHQAAPQDVAAMPAAMLEGILERILGALPPERIAEFVIPVVAPHLAALVRQSPVAVTLVKAVAAEL